MLLLYCSHSRKHFLTFPYSLLNGSDIQERLLRQIIHFAVQYHLEASDRILDRHHHTWDTCKLLGHRERLREETLYLSGTVDREPVLV